MVNHNLAEGTFCSPRTAFARLRLKSKAATNLSIWLRVCWGVKLNLTTAPPRGASGYSTLFT
jgi:hypothetical protein